MLKLTITSTRTIQETELEAELRKLRQLGYRVPSPAEALKGSLGILKNDEGGSVVRVEQLNKF